MSAAEVGFGVVKPPACAPTRPRQLAEEAASHGHELPQAYHRLFWTWFACGFPAFAAVLAIFWLMMTRPQITLFS